MSTQPSAPQEPTIPSSVGTWVIACIPLADGRRVELRLPDALGGSVSTHAPAPGDIASLVIRRRDGSHRRFDLTSLLDTTR